MLNFLKSLIGNNSAKFIADFFAVFYKILGAPVVNGLRNALAWLVNMIAKYVWTVCKWVLGVIDVMQLGFTRLIGIDTGASTLTLGDYIEGMKHIATSSGTNYYDYLMKIFRALFGVAILLMIIFTIVAMAMQEYKLAADGYSKADNSKGKFLRVMLKNIIVIFLIPLIFYTLIVGTNSILTAFYRALGNEPSTTIAGNVLASTTYDANRYRAYANANKRIPITISVYSTENAFGGKKGDDELLKEISNSEVQEKLRVIAGAFANDSFLPFEKSTVNMNGTFSSYQNYSLTYNNEIYEDMGQYFENFICTREQYYVMADFVDFCQRYNIKYYIKSMSESDICWKYVDGITANPEIDEEGNSFGDITLNVTYRNAELVNNPTGMASADGGSNSNNSYSLQITTKLDMTSPISDALTTASKLLGIDEDNSKFNAMERDDSGDYTNLVNWSMRKAHLKLSTKYDVNGNYESGFKLSDPTTWTATDQIIVYEYHRYNNEYGSTNNTLEDYTLEQLQTTGAFWDALEMTYRNYNSNTQTYSEAYSLFCVKLNGNYYRLKESEIEFDEYGHAYFVLDVLDENVDYFNDVLVSVTDSGNDFTLKFSSNFNINDYTTWTFLDQVLVYEYFTNGSINGKLSLSSFANDVADANDIKANIVTVSNNQVTRKGTTEKSNKEYVCINNTYYEKAGLSATKKYGDEGATNFLIEFSEATAMWLGYKLEVTKAEKYGIDSLGGLIATGDNAIAADDVVELDNSNAFYQKYSTMKFKLSDDFSLTSSNTWTFRDYALLYLYIQKLHYDTTITIDTLKVSGLSGDVIRKKDTNDYYLRLIIGTEDCCINLANLEKVSQLPITATLSSELFSELGLSSVRANLLTTFNNTKDLLLNSSVSSHTFYLSENFDRYDSRTWTNGDYLMIYLIDTGVIDVELSLIEYQGYTALCYNVDANGDGTSENYYRFGKVSDENAFFLNESVLESSGYSIDKWFNSNMMSYLLNEIYKVNLSELIVDEMDFAGGMINNPDAYVFTQTIDPTDPSSLQYVLGKDLLTQEGITTNSTKFEYSYANPALVESDETTWNFIDTIIRFKTGRVPTQQNPYVTSLVKYDGKIYLVVEDVMLDISSDSSNFKCLNDGGTILTTKLISNTSRSFSSESELNSYYISNFSNLVRENLNAVTEEIDGEDVVTIEAGESINKKYYYNSSVFNTSTTPSFENSKLYSDFDVVLLKNGITLGPTANGYYTFDVYSFNGNSYLKLSDNCYFCISPNTNAKIYYKDNFLAPVSDMGKITTSYSDSVAVGFLSYCSEDVIKETSENPTPLENKKYYLAKSLRDSTKNAVYTDWKIAGLISMYLDPNGSYLDKTYNSSGEFLSFYNYAEDKTYVAFKSIDKTYYVPLNLWAASADNDNIIDDTLFSYITSSGDAVFTENSGFNYSSLQGTASTSEVALICKKKNYTTINGKIESSTMKDSSGNDVVLVLAEDGGNVVYIYGAKLDASSTGSAIGYLKADGTTKSTVEADAALFELETEATKSASEWNMLDFVIAYSLGTTQRAYIASIVYINDGKYYVKYNGNYILLPKSDTFGLKFTDEQQITSEKFLLNTDYTSLFTYIPDTPSPTIMPLLFCYNKFKQKADDVGYSDCFAEFVEKTLKAAEPNSGEMQLISFSNNFNADDYSTWQISDFILYNAITNGEFGDESFTLAFPFAYIPTYTHTGGKYYNLSYLDRLLYTELGLETSGEPIYFKLCYDKTNYNYYIQLLIDGKSTDFYVLLSDKVSINFSKMQIESTSLNKIYSDSDTITEILSGNRNKYDGGSVLMPYYEGVKSYVVGSANELYDSMSEQPLKQYYYYSESLVTTKQQPVADGQFLGSSTYSNVKEYARGLNYTDLDVILIANGIPSTKLSKTGLYVFDAYTNSSDGGIYIKTAGKDGDYYIKVSNVETDQIYSQEVETIFGDEAAKKLYNSADSFIYISGSGVEVGVDFKIGKDGEPTSSETMYINKNKIEEYKTSFNGGNFQTFANTNGAPGFVFYLLKQDEASGSVECDKIIKFSTNPEEVVSTSSLCYKYKTFYSKYSQSFSNYADRTINVNSFKINMTPTEPGNDDISHEMKIKHEYYKVASDFDFKNKYYFTHDESALAGSDLKKFYYAGSEATAEYIRSKILDKTLEDIHDINFKLSDGFDISDPTTWTGLDYIIVYQFSKGERISHNKFMDMTLNELKTEDYFSASVYKYTDSAKGEQFYLYVNEQVYNVTSYVSLDAAGGYYFGNDVKTGVSSIVDGGDPWASDFQVLSETVKFSLNPNLYVNSTVIYLNSENKDTIDYTTGSNTLNFRYIDTNVAETNYRIKTSDFALYTTTTIVKNVSWVEKLMTDMQVYYPDLNWGVLIATDGWIDTLGEFTSAHVNGLYVGGDNSSNTTAAGLVLSEFFMSVATPVSDSYADYEYSSVFDQDTIRALMLSLCGEENYNALVFEAEVFMDYFNTSFAPIIDDFAREFGEDIGENSLRLNAYKSYLATLLMSSDIGSYLYTIATRVYAEYTICEYLAASAGDYSGYYSYINGLTDEEGNVIDSYTFGSFYELVRYENEYCGNSTPTFTFNYKKAFEKYKDTDGKVAGFSYDNSLLSLENYTQVVKEIMKNLEKEYKTIYKNGYQVAENGKIVDSDGKETTAFKNSIFCYMLHVYYMIKQDINGIEPIYLSYYKQYLDGDMKRWDIVCDENIEEADQYFEGYLSDALKLELNKFISYASVIKGFLPEISIGSYTNEAAFTDKLADIVKAMLDIISPNATLADYGVVPMAAASTLLKDNVSLSNDIKYIMSNSVALIATMNISEDNIISGVFELLLGYVSNGDSSAKTAWEVLNKYYDCVCRVLNELCEIRNILPGQKTANGLGRERVVEDGVQKYYSDAQLDDIIGTFQEIKHNMGQYITSQRRIDRMRKRSITFTLAQFGANYVSSGYNFSVRNKSYNFKTSTDPVRLAEYVYGGAFLESVGVGAQYTSPDFTGIVKASKVYDPVDKVVKTNLDSWLELRTFLSEIASTTADLYYLTNLKDLDVNTKNAIYLTDNITTTFNDDANNTLSVGSIEEMLYNYIVSEIDEEIVNRVIEGKEGIHEKFIAMSEYIFLNSVEESEFEKMTLEEYKRIVVKQLIKNKANGEESADERAARYMVLFNLLSVQVELSLNSGGKLGRIIPRANITRDENGKITAYDNKVQIIGYSSDNNSNSSIVPYDVTTGTVTILNGTFSCSYNTLETVKILSGLENRPTREVLTREYSGTRATDYFDEAYGDTFIACIYNEKDGLYYPILGSGSKNCNSENYQNFYKSDILIHKFVSDYYDNSSNLIICKGVVTADGYPTAIRKYNNPLEIEQKRLLSSSVTTYNAVTFYRTSIGANMGTGDDLIDSSRAVSRVSTRNYTKYVYGTSFTKGIGSSTTYTGKDNLRTVISSDIVTTYVQSTAEYIITQADDYGGISVLDEFSYYYVFSGQTWILLVLAFITIIPVMINAIGGAITRIFDLIVLFLASPLVIATNSLRVDGKNKTYDTWKKNIESVLMGTFGYILGFSFFSIMVPVIYNVNTFVTIGTYNSIKAISGIGGFISYSTINSLARSLWIITAVSILEKVPKLLLPIITAGRGDLTSPDPGLGSINKSLTQKMKDAAGSVEQSIQKVGSVLSGSALLGLLNEVKSTAINMIPGAGAAIEIGSKVRDFRKKKAIDSTEKALTAALVSQGVDAKIAAEAAKVAADTQRKAMEDQKKLKEKMKKHQDTFRKNFLK